jgi:hypothetical protein
MFSLDFGETSFPASLIGTEISHSRGEICSRSIETYAQGEQHVQQFWSGLYSVFVSDIDKLLRLLRPVNSTFSSFR